MIEAAALMGEKKYGEARQLLKPSARPIPTLPDIDFSLGMVALREVKPDGCRGHLPQGLHGQSERRARPGGTGGSASHAGPLRSGHCVPARRRLAKIPSAPICKWPWEMWRCVRVTSTWRLPSFKPCWANWTRTPKPRGDVYFRLGVTLRSKGDLNGAIPVLYKAQRGHARQPLGGERTGAGAADRRPQAGGPRGLRAGH